MVDAVISIARVKTPSVPLIIAGKPTSAINYEAVSSVASYLWDAGRTSVDTIYSREFVCQQPLCQLNRRQD